MSTAINDKLPRLVSWVVVLVRFFLQSPFSMWLFAAILRPRPCVSKIILLFIMTDLQASWDQAGLDAHVPSEGLASFSSIRARRPLECARVTPLLFPGP